MAETTITADPVNTSSNSIEDELAELDAILAEINTTAEPSESDGEQELVAEAETDVLSEEQGQSAEAVAIETSPAQTKAEPSQDQTAQTATEDMAEAIQTATEDAVEALQEDTEETAEAPADEDQENATSDPVAEEVAEPEKPSTDEQAGSDEAEEEPGDAVPDAGEVSGPISPEPVLVHAALVLSWPLVAILTILDKPFANVSLKVKNILGYIAIATTVMAVAIWLLAGFIR